MIKTQLVHSPDMGIFLLWVLLTYGCMLTVPTLLTDIHSTNLRWILEQGGFNLLPHRISQPQQSCVCGISQTPKIIGGMDVEKNEFPWLVQVYDMIDPQLMEQCVGTLITDRHVLTAAHCVRRRVARRILLFLGKHSITAFDGSIRLARAVHIHPNFTMPVQNGNDIAIIELATPVLFQRAIQPVCLPSSMSDYYSNGTEATIAGWGLLKEGGPESQTLQKATIKIMTNSDCQQQFEEMKSNIVITDNMICAGVPEGGKDTCKGDSGGPLMTRNYGQYTISGIASFGIGCGRKRSPGVSVRVDKYMDFILAHTQGGKFCDGAHPW